MINLNNDITDMSEKRKGEVNSKLGEQNSLSFSGEGNNFNKLIIRHSTLFESVMIITE